MAENDTPRTHTLTDEDLQFILRNQGETSNYSTTFLDRLLARLPSRAPADPDAGLRAPWSDAGAGAIKDSGKWVIAHIGVSNHSGDAFAVRSAILAAPKAIALARALAAAGERKNLPYAEFCELCDDAAAILSIADAYKKDKH